MKDDKAEEVEQKEKAEDEEEDRGRITTRRRTRREIRGRIKKRRGAGRPWFGFGTETARGPMIETDILCGGARRGPEGIFSD